MTDHLVSSTNEKSTAELVGDLTQQVRHLVRTEVTLAAHEMRGKAKHAGTGAAIAGAGGLFAFYGGAAVVAACVLALSLVLAAWAAALIVAGALFVVAGLAMLVARGQLRQGRPTPSTTVDSARKDLTVLREARR